MVIKSIYGDDGGLKDIGSDTRCGSGKWNDIVKVSRDIEASGISFYSSFVKNWVTV